MQNFTSALLIPLYYYLKNNVEDIVVFQGLKGLNFKYFPAVEMHFFG